MKHVKNPAKVINTQFEHEKSKKITTDPEFNERWHASQFVVQ